MIGPVFSADKKASRRIPLTVQTGGRELRVRVEAGGRSLAVELSMPHLAGPREDVLLRGTEAREAADGFFLLETADGLAGVALGQPGESPQTAAHRLYTAVLEHTRNLTLQRLWNYIPGINAAGADGMENYRAFNAGRHGVFRQRFGGDFSPKLPAASALGIGGDRMAVIFAAGTAPVRHFENPEQTPAFHYPEKWGKLPPSFARGTRVDGALETVWHLSGTAGIKGHATVGCGSFEEQMRVTLDNVRLMRDLMEVPADTAAQWRVFLRNTEDLAACQRMFAEAFPVEGSAETSVIFLHTDICRACLLVEIEAAFSCPSVGG